MKKSILPIFLALFTLVFVACETSDDPQNEEPKELTTDEAKAIMNSANVEVGAEIDAMYETEGMKAMDRVSELGLDFLGEGDEMFLKANEIKPEVFSKHVAKKNEEQTFGELVGTYTYDASTGRWSIVANDPSDKIVIHFPTEGNTENNATLTFSAFEETKVIFDLYIDEALVLDFSLMVDLSSTGEEEGVEYMLNVPPYKHEVSWAIDATKEEFSNSLMKDDVSLASFSIVAEYAALSMEEGEPSNVSGHIQYGAIKVEGAIDLAGINSLDEALEGANSWEEVLETINSKIDITIVTSPDGDYLGKIEIGLVDGEIAPVIVFADGTVVPAEEYLEGMIESIESLFGEVEEGEDEIFG